MYSCKQYFRDSLKQQVSCNGRFVRYGSTSKSTTGAMVIYFNNIQSLSPKNFMKDFMINFKFKINATSASGKNFAFLKDINNAMRTLITINGSLNYENDGAATTPIFKAYSERYKSVDNLNTNDIWHYEVDGTNWAINTSGRGVTYGTAAAANDFYAYTSVPLLHPYLINGIGGVNSLNIRISLDNSLWSIIDTNLATAITTTLEECVIQYAEYETQSDSFDILVPYFVSYNTQASSGSRFQSQTRNVSSTCSAVFCHLNVNGSIVSAKQTNNQKSLPFTDIKVNVNNNSNCFNANNTFELFSRSKSDEVPYLGTLTDWQDNKIPNEFGSVVKINMHNLPVNISSSDIMRFDADVLATYTNSNVYLYTVYMYVGCLHMSKEKSELQYIADTPMGEIEEHEELMEQLLVGGGLWDKIKTFGKKIIQHAPGLIDKGMRIADVVAPNSGVSKGFEKASQISNILTGTSTALF